MGELGPSPALREQCDRDREERYLPPDRRRMSGDAAKVVGGTGRNPSASELENSH